MTMIDAWGVHLKKYKNDPEYAKEYDVLEEEFVLAAAEIEARINANR